MAAPIGNQFWKLRTKHGRDKLFSSPEILWEAACEYFQYVIDNPIEVEETKTKPNSVEVTVNKLQRPFSWDGLELYLDIESLRDYKTNPNYKDFSQVITRIGKVIYTNKFEGASAGVFNHNIIARDLGLKDQTENKNTNAPITIQINGNSLELE
jgi:hypothetical protein